MDLEAVRDHVEILQYVKKQKAKLKEMEERSRAAVEEALGDNEVGTLDDQTVITWKHFQQQRLDQKALKEDLPEVAEHYTETVNVRRFTITES